ncbi:MAG TPA: class I SAM-dependent methyltransferase [Terriglobia bacterium]|nr:class I SAM-dependent methyltransferase [Terriglobia bacterium]
MNTLVSSSSQDPYAFVAKFYDRVPPYHDRQDVAFFVDRAREAGGPVLEIGCGTGRVLIPTARASVEIVGLDASPAMLARCREKLSRETGEVRSHATLAEADMRRFELEPARFALVTIPFRPFQHLLTVDDQLACLARIRHHLAPGGRLVLDVFNPSIPYLVSERDLANLLGKEPEFAMPDGSRVRRTHRTLGRDFLTQILDLEITYHVTHPGGREDELIHRFRLRYFFRFEAEHLLARAGFEVEHLYADYDGSPYGSKIPGELIFVARKAG